MPPIAVLIAWLWLGEVPVAAELAGGLVVIAGVLIVSQGGKIAAQIIRTFAATHRLQLVKE